MSLPRGVVSRPPVLSPKRGALARIARTIGFLLLFALPFVAHVAAQVPGRVWQYETPRIEAEIRAEREAQRRLAAERAALLAPERLAREARRLDLVPPSPFDQPRRLARVAAEREAR